MKCSTIKASEFLAGKKECCICHNEFWGYGNNAEPYKSGICCDNCNWSIVLKLRIMKGGDSNESQ